jgi:hypothetical protein
LPVVHCAFSPEETRTARFHSIEIIAARERLAFAPTKKKGHTLPAGSRLLEPSGCAILNLGTRTYRMMDQKETASIAVYIIKRHPLEVQSEASFEWIDLDSNVEAQLRALAGEIQLEEVAFFVDERPAGPAWKRLIGALQDERIRQVITHLAPLSSAQRQQLIGVCADMGAHLVTPSDAGRNRIEE